MNRVCTQPMHGVTYIVIFCMVLCVSMHNVTCMYGACDLECGNEEYMCRWRFTIKLIVFPNQTCTYMISHFSYRAMFTYESTHRKCPLMFMFTMFTVPYCLSFSLPSHTVWTNCYIVNVPGVVIIIALLVLNIVALFVALALCYKWRLMGMYLCIIVCSRLLPCKFVQFMRILSPISYIITTGPVSYKEFMNYAHVLHVRMCYIDLHILVSHVSSL